MTNERRAELMRAMDGHEDETPVLFLNGWSPAELTCGELRELLTSEPSDAASPPAPSGSVMWASLAAIAWAIAWATRGTQRPK